VRELGRTGRVGVGEVVDDAPAAVAGVRPGDLIVAVDGRQVETMAELQRLLVGERIGAPVTFTVARHEHVLDIVVIPNELAA
jgi:S1-C subfamily serine protease